MPATQEKARRRNATGLKNLIRTGSTQAAFVGSRVPLAVVALHACRPATQGFQAPFTTRAESSNCSPP